MGELRGRWLDLGQCSPVSLHAAYSGLAQAMADDASPLLVWAHSRAHVTTGASQWAGAELDLHVCRQMGIDIVARPLGGGMAWIDEHQACFFFITPYRRLGGRHLQLFTRCLEAVVAVYHRFGLPVERVGETDIWLAGKKILGSGAATINRAMVFGSSFLLGFDSAAFSRVVACPSEGFRAWLREALAAGMTCWEAYAPPPAESALRIALREAFGAAFDCRFEPANISAAEATAMEAAREDCEVVCAPGARRRVRHGIKVNHQTYLVETGAGADSLRLWLAHGRIHRITAGDVGIARALQYWLNYEPERVCLLAASRKGRSGDRRQVGAPLAGSAAEYWTARIDEAACDVRRLWHG